MPLRPSDIWHEDDGIPSMEVIQRYLNGQMGRDELYQFEKLIAGSEMVSEAVDGLRLSSENNLKSIQDINGLIDQQVNRKVKIVSLVNYGNLALAASFALLVTIGGMFFLSRIKNESISKSETSVAEERDSSQNAVTKPSASPMKDDKSNGPIALAEDEASNGLNQRFAKGVNGSLEDESPKNIDAPTSPVNLPTTQMAYSTKAEKSLEEAEFQQSRAGAYDSISREVNSMPKDMLALGTSISSKADDTMEEQKESANQKSDKKTIAAPIASRSLKSKKSSPNPNLGTESSANTTFPGYIDNLMSEGNYVLALKELEGIVLLNDNRKDEALWMKSLCLIQLNKKNEAKEILYQLADSKGEFKTKALEALEALK